MLLCWKIKYMLGLVDGMGRVQTTGFVKDLCSYQGCSVALMPALACDVCITPVQAMLDLHHVTQPKIMSCAAASVVGKACDLPFY